MQLATAIVQFPSPLVGVPARVRAPQRGSLARLNGFRFMVYRHSFSARRCSRSARLNARSIGRVPPLSAFLDVLALPSAVFGPVECSNGRHSRFFPLAFCILPRSTVACGDFLILLFNRAKFGRMPDRCFDPARNNCRRYGNRLNRSWLF